MGLIICKTKNQILKNLEIRYEVFTKEQNIKEELDMDFLEYNGEMFLYANEEEEYVACARIIFEGNRVHLRRVATLKEYRNMGYASKMIKAIEKIIYTMDEVNEIYVSSQLDKKAFYEKNGYVSYGDAFLDADIKHINMHKFIRK